MRLVMLSVQHLSVVSQRLTELAVHVELLRHPQRSRLEEGFETPRHHPEIGLEDALELEQRLVIESHVLKVFDPDPGLSQAVLDGARGEGWITFLPRKALLGGGGDDVAVTDEAGRAVVVEGRDSENVRGTHEAYSSGRIPLPS